MSNQKIIYFGAGVIVGIVVYQLVLAKRRVA